MPGRENATWRYTASYDELRWEAGQGQYQTDEGFLILVQYVTINVHLDRLTSFAAKFARVPPVQLARTINPALHR
jgi:hypothetical protein